MSTIPLSSEQMLLLQKENAELRSLTATLHATVAELKAQLLLAIEQAKAAAPKRTLPVRETIEIVPEAGKKDPALYEKIGEERTFEIDIAPPQIIKREIIRPKYKHAINRSLAPARIAPGGFASAGLVAWVLTAKYADHLPLHRQEKMLARWGAPISRQNLCDWVGLATPFLEPLVKLMKADLLKSGYVQADETPVKCNDPDLKDGKPPKATSGRCPGRRLARQHLVGER